MATMKDNFLIMGAIARRASRMAAENNLEYEYIDALMDVEAAHADIPLDLAELAAADDVNFAHDVFGIRRYLDRTSCKLTDCFVPRFAQKVSR